MTVNELAKLRAAYVQGSERATLLQIRALAQQKAQANREKTSRLEQQERVCINTLHALAAEGGVPLEFCVGVQTLAAAFEVYPSYVTALAFAPTNPGVALILTSGIDAGFVFLGWQLGVHSRSSLDVGPRKDPWWIRLSVAMTVALLAMVFLKRALSFSAFLMGSALLDAAVLTTLSAICVLCAAYFGNVAESFAHRNQRSTAKGLARALTRARSAQIPLNRAYEAADGAARQDAAAFVLDTLSSGTPIPTTIFQRAVAYILDGVDRGGDEGPPPALVAA